MQVIILATSETARLQPLTDSMPTVMLPVLNRPIMVGVVEQLARQGFKKAFVSLYHLPGSVEAFFGSGQRWNITLDYILQRERWGTAGSLKWAENSLTDTFLVLPADQIFDLDISALLAWHKGCKSHASIVLHPNGTGPRVGVTPDGRVVAIHSMNAAPSVSSDAAQPGSCTGIYLFEPSILESIPSRKEWDIANQLFPALLDQGIPVYAFPLSGFWKSVDSLANFHAIQWEYLNYIENGVSGGRQLIRPDIPFRARSVAKGIWIGRNTLIDPRARLSPPVFVGENCFIGQNVELGPEAVIGSNVLVDDGATISHSTILDNTYVGQLVQIKNSIALAGLLVNAKSGESTEVVDQFLLGEARTFGPESFIQRLPDFIISMFLLIGLFPIILLLGLTALISSGNMFSRGIMVGTRSRSTSFLIGEDALQTLKLIRFSTRKSNGEMTRFGNWLERCDLHRLPELLNVLNGDLRLIGVKSLYPEETSKIVEAWQKKRNEYYPGFTGLWYIQGTSTTTLDGTLIADAYYVATRNWREDLRILWQTLPAWWRRARRETKLSNSLTSVT